MNMNALLPPALPEAKVRSAVTAEQGRSEPIGGRRGPGHPWRSGNGAAAVRADIKRSG